MEKINFHLFSDHLTFQFYYIIVYHMILTCIIDAFNTEREFGRIGIKWVVVHSSIHDSLWSIQPNKFKIIRTEDEI